SIKALEIAEEQDAVREYGSSDSGASLGDILGAALKERGDAPAEKAPAKKAEPKKADKAEAKTDGDAPDFDAMTKAQLVEYAEANGIEIKKSAKVDEVREAVKAGA
ncbi:MAG TPA: hypothetical protein DCQ53_11435, partial [Alphaproteobacteria bacterium]|nr:hypothetical protein [Alphaproteobacteria bacterium]